MRITNAWNAYEAAWRKFGESIVRNKWDAERLGDNEIALFYDGLDAILCSRAYFREPSARNLERLRRHIRRTRNAIETFTKYTKTSNDLTKDEHDALNRAPKLFEQFVGSVIDIIREPL